MAHAIKRTYSSHAQKAVELIGKQIKQRRIETKTPAADIAERAGITRVSLRNIENGAMGSSIGLVFEVATILGIPLISEDEDQLDRMVKQTDSMLAILPKTAPKRTSIVKDDF